MSKMAIAFLSIASGCVIAIYGIWLFSHATAFVVGGVVLIVGGLLIDFDKKRS